MDTIQKLEIFFAGLNSKLETAKEIKEQYNKTMALEFNIFNNFFHLGENKTSEILAFFLDKKQTHGQGSIFLELFLKKFGLPEELANKDIIVSCEYPIEEYRRIDIYITFNQKEYIIAIENKIGAIDQPQQLKDYNQHLINATDDNYTLFYLNPDGVPPSNDSIPEKELNDLKLKNKIQIINYKKDIIELVEEWYKNCQADKVRFILNDFKQYLNQEINGENIMENNSETVAKHIIANNNIEIAFEVTNAINKVEKNLISIFKVQINKIADDDNRIGKCDFCDDFGEKDSYFRFPFKDSFYIYFLFPANNFVDFMYGIDCDEENRNKYRETVANKIGSIGIGHDSWVWADKFEKEYLNWGNNAKPWLAIQNGELVINIKKKTEYLINVLSELNF